MKLSKRVYDFALGVIRSEPDTSPNRMTVFFEYEDLEKELVDDDFARWLNLNHTKPVNVITDTFKSGWRVTYSGHFKAEIDLQEFSNDEKECDAYYSKHDFYDIILI